MWELTKYLQKYKKQTILGPIFKIIEAVFELMVPFVVVNIIDVGIANGDREYIYRMGLLLVVLAVLGYASSIICQYYASYASQGFGTELRNELFQHIMSFSQDEMGQFQTSSLITRMTNDINQLQLAIAMFIRLAFRTPFIIIGSIICGMLIDMKLSMIFLVATPVLAVVIYLVMSKSAPYYRKIQKKLDEISFAFKENLTGVRVIRAFSRQADEVNKFNQQVDEQKENMIRVGKIAALLNPVTFVIVNVAIMVILWSSGIQVNLGELSQGEVIAFINFMNQILLALLVLANIIVIFNKAGTSAKRVAEVLAVHPTSQVGTSSLSKKENGMKIDFEHVSFTYYQNSEYVLEDISFQVKKGQTIGIIGGTGSGKSTLIKLIPGFYLNYEGNIYIDGLSVKDYNLSTLRKKIAIVPQKSVLFSGTIRENLKWGQEDASDEQMIEALQVAQAYEFVQALENGLDHQVTQGGKNFSGGQRQRLTIARALIANPEILILDDSASALDFATDAKLRKAIADYSNEVVVIIVSQRTNSVKHAEQIICLDEGKAVGIGTHQHLFTTCEVYKEICLSQVSEEEALQS